MDIKTVFGKRQFESGKEQTFDIGGYKLAARREKEGWYLAFKAKETNEANEPFDILKDGEYFQSGKSNFLIINPALPAKPLVFKGSKLFIAPKQRVTFFIKIPLDIEVFFSKNQPENRLKIISPVRLSDTWFGEPDLGEPAFSIGNEYFMNYDKIETSVLEAICPINIFNNAPGVLEVERLILRTDNMTLYKNGERIITSVNEVEYRGKDTISSADYHYSKIYHGEKQEVLVNQRISGGLLKKNFHFIRSIYRFE